MRVLALDTSTRSTSVAYCDGAHVLEARDDPDPGARPGHARRLLPLAAEVLKRGGVEWSELERIVVGRGPGTFTGLRIGIATARGLAAALGAPLTGVSTLESLALGTRRFQPPPEIVVAVLDARRGEVFAAAWRTDGTGRREPLIEPCAIAPEALSERLAGLGGTPLAIGDGAVEFRRALVRSGAVIPPDDSEIHRVTATLHCELARGAPGGRPETVTPEYLRLPDAELARRSARADAP